MNALGHKNEKLQCHTEDMKSFQENRSIHDSMNLPKIEFISLWRRSTKTDNQVLYMYTTQVLISAMSIQINGSQTLNINISQYLNLDIHVSKPKYYLNS